jgi:hypothetical protein
MIAGTPMKIRSSLAFVTFGVILLVSARINSQVSGATFTRSVSDASGAVIPYPQISIKNVWLVSATSSFDTRLDSSPSRVSRIWSNTSGMRMSVLPTWKGSSSILTISPTPRPGPVTAVVAPWDIHDALAGNGSASSGKGTGALPTVRNEDSH